MIPDRRSTGVFLAGIATFINLYCTQSLLPTLATVFAVPLPRTSLTVTAPLAAVAIVAPFVGSISDMLGRKRLIVTAAFLLVIPTLLAASAGSLHALVLWRFLQGLMLPFIFAVTVAYLGDECEGPQAIRMAGTYSIGSILGGFSGRAVAGAVASLADWRAALVAIGLITLAAAAGIALALPAERRFRPVRGLAASLGSFRRHLTNGKLLATYAIGFGVLFSMVATLTYVNFVLAAPPYHLGPGALGAIFTVYLLGIVVTPLATRLAVRVGRRVTLALAVLAGIIGLALTLLHPLAMIVAGIALASSCTFILQALAISYIGVAAETAKSTAVGLYVTCYYIGGSLGGILPAGLWHHYGWPGCVVLCMLVQLGMLAVAARFWREPARA
jgi:YNFM family putative membrane transporter